MDQTPIHDTHNADLLRCIPPASRALIEIGCSSGALAREFKRISPTAHYFGVDIDPAYAKIAEKYCDRAESFDIESKELDFFADCRDKDCWIFGDTLEHLRDPWTVLRNIRSVIPAGGCIVACIPNAQHWSIQTRLNSGQFRYEDSGLLDRTHLRWFTRLTIIEMFASAGFSIAEGLPRVFTEPDRERFLPIIAAMAKAAGEDPDAAVRDSLPLQYVVRATPVG